MIYDKFRIINKNGKPIIGDIKFDDDNKEKPVVFFLHGFKGFKEWGFFPYATEKIALSGAISVCFNFSLNGMVEGSEWVENTEDFANNTVSQELEDTRFTVDNFINGNIITPKILERNWNGDVFLIGHSLGGAISILTARKDDKIGKIALWGSISTFDRYTERQKKLWRETGFYEFTVAKTGQVVRMKVDYMEDVIKNIDKYNLTSAIRELKAEVLIVHGKLDMAVRFREAQTLFNAGDKDKTFLEAIPKTGHVFGVEQPFKETNPALEMVLEKTINFFGLK